LEYLFRLDIISIKIGIVVTAINADKKLGFPKVEKKNKVVASHLNGSKFNSCSRLYKITKIPLRAILVSIFLLNLSN
jgi:hypothetical protein